MSTRTNSYVSKNLATAAENLAQVAGTDDASTVAAVRAFYYLALAVVMALCYIADAVVSLRPKP